METVVGGTLENLPHWESVSGSPDVLAEVTAAQAEYATPGLESIMKRQQPGLKLVKKDRRNCTNGGAFGHPKPPVLYGKCNWRRSER